MKNSKNLDKWRFWPIIILAFNYLANVNIIGLIIPIYFFRMGISSEFIGVVAAGTTLTYILSPILLNKFSEKWRRKTSIIIAMGGTSIAQILFYFTLQPIPFLIARMTEGIFMGFFWTNLQSSISDNIHHNHKKMTTLYNFSWNAGCLFGFILGAIITLNFPDITLLFMISPIFIFMNLFISIFIFQEPKKINIDSAHMKSVDIEQNQNNSQIQNKDLNKIEKNYEFNEISFPIVYPVLLLIVFSLTKGVIGFIFPMKSEFLNIKVPAVYSAIFFLGLTQSISMTLVSPIKLRTLKTITKISITALAFLLVLMGLNTNYFLFIVLFILIGCCAGTLYGLVLRLILNLNMKKNTSKYSSSFESFIGLNFLLSSVISGFVIGFNLDLMFYLLFIIFIAIALVLIIFLDKRIKF
ncbi:MAG: MFS transporter, partial [Candidatus Lokiarchaeota archaeon]|nr:MFS transporter [Candidatus Lokiarchaeota archaeon]